MTAEILYPRGLFQNFRFETAHAADAPPQPARKGLEGRPGGSFPAPAPGMKRSGTPESPVSLLYAPDTA